MILNILCYFPTACADALAGAASPLPEAKTEGILTVGEACEVHGYYISPDWPSTDGASRKLIMVFQYVF